MGNRKVLVNRSSNAVIGLYKAPLQFSTGNEYVIDIPDSITFDSLPSDVESVYSAKLDGLLALNPLMTQSFSADITEIPTQIDPTLSRGYIINKHGVTLAPNATIVTQQLTPVNSFDTIYLHYYGYLFSRVANNISNSPALMLYNYDPQAIQFTEFDPNTLEVSITDAAGTSSLFFPTIDTPFSASFDTFRIKITNLATQAQRVSDYYLLYNAAQAV